MENKTITMPLSEYEQLEDDIKLLRRLFNEIKVEKEEIIQAKAVFIERILTYDRVGRSKIDTLRPRIFGNGVELNKGIRELRNEMDKIYILYNEREEKLVDKFNKSIQEYVEQSAILERESKEIKSKWWYKLFSKF